jgi:hypothetical protein
MLEASLEPVIPARKPEEKIVKKKQIKKRKRVDKCLKQVN